MKVLSITLSIHPKVGTGTRHPASSRKKLDGWYFFGAVHPGVVHRLLVNGQNVSSDLPQGLETGKERDAKSDNMEVSEVMGVPSNHPFS